MAIRLELTADASAATQTVQGFADNAKRAFAKVEADVASMAQKTGQSTTEMQQRYQQLARASGTAFEAMRLTGRTAASSLTDGFTQAFQRMQTEQQRSRQAMSSGLNTLAQDVKRTASVVGLSTGQAFQTVTMSSSQMRRGMEESAASAANLGRVMAGVRNIAAAFGLSLWLGTVVQGLRESSEASVRLENSLTGLSSIAKAFKTDIDATKLAALALSRDGLMSIADSARGLKNLLATGFSLPQAINLMNAFKDSAAFNRQGMLDFGEAVARATEGVRMGMSTLSDAAGITKNLSQILKEAGLNADDLSKVTSDVNVRMALYTGLLKEAKPFQGDANLLTQQFSGALARLKTEIELNAAAIGKLINSELKPYIDFITKLLAMARPHLQEMGEEAKGVDQLRKTYGAYSRQLQDVQKQLAEIGDKPQLGLLGALLTPEMDARRRTLLKVQEELTQQVETYGGVLDAIAVKEREQLELKQRVMELAGATAFLEQENVTTQVKDAEKIKEAWEGLQTKLRSTIQNRVKAEIEEINKAFMKYVELGGDYVKAADTREKAIANVEAKATQDRQAQLLKAQEQETQAVIHGKELRISQIMSELDAQGRGWEELGALAKTVATEQIAQAQREASQRIQVAALTGDSIEAIQRGLAAEIQDIQGKSLQTMQAAEHKFTEALKQESKAQADAWFKKEEQRVQATTQTLEELDKLVLDQIGAEEALIQEQVRGEILTKEQGLERLSALQTERFNRRRDQIEWEGRLLADLGVEEELIQRRTMAALTVLATQQKMDQLKLLNEQTEAWRIYFERIQGLMADSFFDVMEGKFKTLAETATAFLSAFHHAISEFLAKEAVERFKALLNPSTAGAGGAGVGAIAVPIPSTTGVFGTPPPAFAGGVAGAEAGGTVVNQTITQKIGPFLPIIAIGAGSALSLAQGASSGNTGQIGSGVGGLVGMGAGFLIGGPVGALLGGAIGSVGGGLLGGLFGGGSTITARDRERMEMEARAKALKKEIEQAVDEMIFGPMHAALKVLGRQRIEGLDLAGTIQGRRAGLTPDLVERGFKVQGQKVVDDFLKPIRQEIEAMTVPDTVVELRRLTEQFNTLTASAQELGFTFRDLDVQGAAEAAGEVARLFELQRQQIIDKFLKPLQQQLETLQLPPLIVALHDLDREFQTVFETASQLGVGMNEAQAAFSLQRQKLIEGFIKPMEKQLEALQLPPLIVQLNQLSREFQETLKTTTALGQGTELATTIFETAYHQIREKFLEPFRATIERLRLPPVIAQLKQLEREFADAREAARQLGPALDDVNVAFNLARQEIIDNFLAPFQDRIDELTLPPVIRDLQTLQKAFEEAQDAAAQLGVGMDQVAQSFALAQQKAIDDFLKPFQQQIEELTLDPFTFQLLQLQRSFAEALATAAQLGVGLDVVTQAMALAEQALVDQFQQPITDAMKRLADQLDQLALSGMTAAQKTSFFTQKIATLTTKLAQVQTTEEAIRLTDELAQATLDRYEAEVQALEELQSQVLALQGAQTRLQDATDAITVSLLDSADQVTFFQGKIDSLQQQLSQTDDIETFVSLTDDLIAATQARADAEIAAIDAIEQAVMAGVSTINDLSRTIDDLTLSGMDSADQVTFWSGKIDELTAAFAQADLAGQVELTQDLVAAIQARLAAETQVVQEEVDLQQQAAQDIIDQLTAVQQASDQLDETLRGLALDMMAPVDQIASLTTELSDLQRQLADQNLTIDEQIALVDEIGRVSQQRYQTELAFIDDIQTQTDEATRAIDDYTRQIDDLRKTIDGVVKSIQDQIFQLNLAEMNESDRLTALQEHVGALVSELEAGLMGGQLATDDALALLGDSRDALTDLLQATDQMISQVEQTAQDTTASLSLDELESLRTHTVSGLESMVDLLDAMGATGLFSATTLDSLRSQAVLTLQALDAAGHTQSELLAAFTTAVPAINSLVSGTDALLGAISTEATLRDTYVELAGLRNEAVASLDGLRTTMGTMSGTAGLSLTELTAIKTNAIAQLESLLGLSEEIYTQGAAKIQEQIDVQNDILETLGDQLEAQFGTRTASEAIKVATQTMQTTLGQAKLVLDAQAASLTTLAATNPLITNMEVDLDKVRDLTERLMEPHLAEAEAALAAIQEDLAGSILTELEALGLLPTIQAALDGTDLSAPLAQLQQLLVTDDALGSLDDIGTADELQKMFDGLKDTVMDDTLDQLEDIDLLIGQQLTQLTGTSSATDALLKIEQDIVAARQRAYDAIAALTIPTPVPFPTTIAISTLPGVTVVNPVTSMAISNLPAEIGTTTNPMIVVVSNPVSTVAVSALPSADAEHLREIAERLFYSGTSVAQSAWDTAARLFYSGASVAQSAWDTAARLWSQGTSVAQSAWDTAARLWSQGSAAGWLEYIGGTVDPRRGTISVTAYAPGAQHGLAEVPDEGLFHLHPGEMVLPASVAEPLRRGAAGSGMTPFSQAGASAGAGPAGGGHGGPQEVHLHFHMEGAIVDRVALDRWTEEKLLPIIRSLSRQGITVTYDSGVEPVTRGRAA